MNTQVLKHAEDKEHFQKLWNSNTILREVLVKYLEWKIRPMPVVDYESPSWAYKQADHNGYNRALTEVLDILKKDN